MKKIIKNTFGAIFFAAAFSVSSANAGGFFGDIVNVVAPGVGTQMDQVNAQIKQTIPAYGAADRYITQCVRDAMGNAVQQIVDPQGAVIQTIPCTGG
jgi:hypothetical protein